jgi:hypothetical protein
MFGFRVILWHRDPLLAKDLETNETTHLCNNRITGSGVFYSVHAKKKTKYSKINNNSNMLFTYYR